MKELLNRECIPAAGELYRHFKGNLYQIIGLATNSETEETMVVYQAMYGEYRWYVRSLAEFMSPVDKGKYPSASQKYRFEQVRQVNEIYSVCGAEAADTKPKAECYKTVGKVQQTRTYANAADRYVSDNQEQKGSEFEEEQVRPELLMFLDAESASEKLRVLHEIRKKLDEDLLTTIELSMDLMPDERESMERRLDLIERTLEKRIKYEGGRLR